MEGSIWHVHFVYMNRYECLCLSSRMKLEIRSSFIQTFIFFFFVFTYIAIDTYKVGGENRVNIQLNLFLFPLSID